MKVTSTIITKVAEATSDNGSYNLEYNIADGVLERVQTTVFKTTEGSSQRVAVGNVYYDRGSVTVNMPFGSDMAKYISDVVGYIETILSEVAAETAVNDSATTES